MDAEMKIVSMAQNVPGPVAVARLVAAGASAIKIEAPWGDPLHGFCRPWYDELHAGVTIARLDLKSADGMRALMDLLGSADVFIASHRPSALGRLGLDAPALAMRFPLLRHLNIVGNTAHPEEPGHDVTYQAQAGLLQGGLPKTLLADLLGAERAHAAVLEMMHKGPGGSRVVGLFDALKDLTAPLRHGLTAPGGVLGGANPAYGVYAARDGAVAVGALEPHFRERLYAALGLADGSPIAAVMTTRTAAEWEHWAAERDLPVKAITAAD
ncbi:MAG: CoA transferase [Acidobacteriota bacterium]|nr:CoA transferase [Acidobacteriota bacterium]